MSDIIRTTNFASLLCSDHRLLDVRSEAEFAAGHIPGSINLPILRTRERATVGQCYKKLGPDSALALAHSIVAGEIKRQRRDAWLSSLNQFSIGALTCARGGMRSGFAQKWLSEGGAKLPRIEGGYKAMRSYLRDSLPALCSDLSLTLISGKTGVGKTDFLNTVAPKKPVLDLEKFANHSGSAFGSLHGDQPGQATFENTLAIHFMKAEGQRHFFVEDESKKIGKLLIPPEVFERMNEAPIMLLESTLEQRVSRIINDYIITVYNNDQSIHRLKNYLLNSVQKISRRLGGAMTTKVTRMIEGAVEGQISDGDFNTHRDWIMLLLKHYYDPFYENGIRKNAARIIAKGNKDELLERICN